MGNILALLRKQLKDTLKNKNVLVQFIMFPAIAVLMTQAVKMEGLPKNYFVFLFASMYIGMAPLTAVTAILSEEKEKHTLKALLMANVSMPQYLTAVVSYIFVICMLGAVCFGGTGSLSGRELLLFLGYMGVGTILSSLVGAVIGIACKNQMSATSMTVPLMIMISFAPMLSSFNQTIKKFSAFLYSQQIYLGMNDLENGSISMKTASILLVNLFAVTILFLYVYRRSCREE